MTAQTPLHFDDYCLRIKRRLTTLDDCLALSLQQHKVHTKGKAAWTKHVQKIAQMLAFQPHRSEEDPNDISAAESLLENYFMLVRRPSLLARCISRVDAFIIRASALHLLWPF